VPPVADYDVVICGAGVAGLALAALLGKQGRRVLVVEKHRHYPIVHKGELFQPRSLQIMHQSGLLTPLREAGARDVTALACRTSCGHFLTALDYRLLGGTFQRGMVQSYRRTLDTMAAHLGPAVSVWLGTRAQRPLYDRAGRVCGVSVLGDDGSVDVHARLTVAADGPASKLRDAVGISVNPHPYGHQFASFEIENSPAIGDEMNAYLTRDGIRALFELPGRRARLHVQIPSGAFRGVGRAGLKPWTDSLLRATPALDRVADPLRASCDSVQVLSASRFLVPCWTRPGFVLIGDAAHCVHPMVGQGMNAAIMDASQLACALADLSALTEADVSDALGRYERARRRQLEYVARLSHNMALLLTGTSWAAHALRHEVLLHNHGNVRLRRRLVQNISGLSAQPLTPREWASVLTPLRGAGGA
jgi:2-polyprenyl-6-methoxyphenol hydroxylase-like FAD-dependent oxidoreductase